MIGIGNVVKKWTTRRELTYSVMTVLLASVALAAGAQPMTSRVSLNSVGVEGDQASHSSSLSADGRYVAFQSRAFNLVSEQTEGWRDIFVKDRTTAAIACVSTSSLGLQGNNHSDHPFISADGRYVAFESLASNFVAGDNNGRADIYVKDRETHTLECISLNSEGLPGNGSSVNVCLSADGRYVAFESLASDLVTGDTQGYRDIFVKDRATGDIERISVNSAGVAGNNNSFNPRLSADGRYVAFESLARNLVPNDLGNRSDIFVKDRLTGAIERISVNAAGEEANFHCNWPAISADGRYVAFRTGASNLVPGDTNNFMDIFLKDRLTGAVERVSTAGAQGIPLSSAIRHYPSLSADGRYIAFDSSASNLVTGDTNSQSDAFMKDRETGIITRLSVSSIGVQGNQHSEAPSLSADGRYASFHSGSNTLVSSDTNGTDVFVRGPLTEAITISGKVMLEGLVSTAVPQMVTFTFRSSGHEDVIRTAAIGPTGTFWVTGLEPRSYSLHIQGTKWLAANVAVDASEGDVSNVDVTLISGDANNDNSVDVFDLDLLIQAFNSIPTDANWNPVADFNGDDSVDIFDLDFLIRNFNREGEE